MRYAVRAPDGSMGYFHKGMCGVFENPLELAKKCAEKCEGTVMVENTHKYRWQKNGVDIFPRWTPLKKDT